MKSNTRITPRRLGALLPAALLALATLASPLQAADPPGRASVVQMGTDQVVPGRYIVVFKDDVANPAAVARQMAAAHGLAPDFVYTTAIKGFAANVPERALAGLSRDPRVDHVTADLVAHTLAQSVPTGIRRSFDVTPPEFFDGTAVVDGTDDRVDVDVAVFDTGIIDHADLNLFMEVNCATGGPFGGSCSVGSASDGNGHGTHVAGTIAALDNGIGVVGVAPGARLWAIRILNNQGSGYLSWILGGIDWVAANGGDVDVANMSIGFSSKVPDVCDAIANLPNHIVVAVAAGNSSQDAFNVSPADCANHPGANVLTVSALADFDGLPGYAGSPTCRSDEDDTLANFSNYGATVGIAAPGVCIESTWNNGGYHTISGTSMASPHVAGAAALLASGANPPPAATIMSTLIDSGNFNWDDDSLDGVQEPLLDMSSFAEPTYVGSTPLENQPPSVAVINPLSDATVTGMETVQISASDAEDDLVLEGSLDVTWSVDGGSSTAATYNGLTGYYEASWDTSGLPLGSTHTIDAAVLDSEGLPANAGSTNVTILDPNATTDVSTAVACDQWGGKNGVLHLAFVVEVEDDALAIPIQGATVEATITRDGGAFWSGDAISDSTGTVAFEFKKADPGIYDLTIDSVTGTGLNWTKAAASGQCSK